MTTPTAIIIGFSLIAAAILIQPLTSTMLIPEAHAQLRDERFQDVGAALDEHCERYL
jgi:hypothetical protein